MVAAGGRGIDAEDLRGKLMDLEAGVEEIVLQGVPIGTIEVIQEDTEAVITELLRTQGGAEEGTQRVLEAVGPILDSGLAMIGLREDVGDPADGEVAQGQTLVQMMAAQMLVQSSSDLHLVHHAQQQRDIVDSLRFPGHDADASGLFPTRGICIRAPEARRR